MNIQSLYVRNFRNIEEAHLDFAKGLNVFCGRNAQGKTNLLEAIILLSTGKSFRTAHLNELIRTDASFFFLEAQILRDRVVQVVRLSFDGISRTVECNATRHPSFQPLLGLLPSILYAPPDLELISGPPTARRRFLSMHLAQSDPLYVHHLFRFWRAMKQRNSLLRLSNQEGIECWEAEMSFAAAYLFNERLHLIEELNQALLLSCQTLSAEPLQLRFTSTYPAKSEDYLALLRKNRTKEQQLGLTLHGPHRDDFTLFVEQKPARQFASEGQKRTALASLRLAEWKRLQQQAHVSPILGIDDFELHLDQERQRLFQAALEELGQVFVSTPELKPSWASAKHFTISSGKIVN